jgi:FkbM family methyltransferase
MLAKIRSRYFSELERDLRYRIRERTRPAVVDVMGIKISTASPIVTSKIRRLIYRGTYESTEMHIVRRHLSVGDRVLEIGAGLGAVGALCATIIGEDRVVSVEANPQLEALIKENHRLNAVAPKLLIAMVDHSEGEGKFFVQDEFTGSSGISRSGNAEEITVPKRSLSALLDEHRANFLIADIEGFESHIFDNCTLRGVEKICLELHPHIIGDAGCDAVIRTLQGKGFIMSIDDLANRIFYFYKEVVKDHLVQR